MNNSSIVDVHDLSISYDNNKVLNNLNLTLESRSTYALLGPSGCGKTTLLYALANLLSNQCTKEGYIDTVSDIKISTVLQDYGLFPWKTVLENTMLPLSIHSKKRRQKLNDKPDDSDTKKAIHLLHELKLDEHLNHYPNELSGGQKQRVAIGRSWLMNPDLLLLDEPFSSLDALTRESLQEQVKSLYKDAPFTIFLVTHSIEEAVFLGQTILIMDQYGTIIKTLTNESFNLDSQREEESFYKQCVLIRKIMQGDYHEKTSIHI